MAPQLGATFVPGGFDDYYMPEVVAPSPQRVTPQVPQNMQEDLQRMELEASGPELHSESAQASQLRREPSLSGYTTGREDDPPNITAYDQPSTRSEARADAMSSRDAPNFSPFPKIQKSDNVPPADDEKEEILWNAREHVLHSHNVSMQITWARDVLNWAEVATEAAARERPPRPSTPRIEHELREDATRIISYLAEQEHPQALYIRSKWLEFGKFGNRVDKREAYNGYKKAAELGHARSEYRIGMLFEQSNDMTKAKEHYYKGLAQGDSAAMYRMGMMSLLGQHGEHKDFRSGIDRILAAAEASDEDAPQGAFVYGMLAARDLPDIQVPDSILRQDLTTARMYIEKSAYQGFAKAQLKMGQAFELCQLGCDFNPAFSLHYYGLAAKQGLPEAALGVSRWFLFGYEGVFKKNEELAYKYALQAAEDKLPTGEFALGYYNEIGIHVSKNLSEARRWYQLAADHGNTDAIGRLDSLNDDKSLSKQDHETTTLTRIKSQHGSQRGKRPDRFKQSQQMPTLNEGSPSATPNGPSPRPSPGLRPTIVSEQATYPDPSRASYGSAYDDRQPAFNIRLDGGAGQPARPHSAAPYPVDDQPPPLNVRPRSTAPYPEDDIRPLPLQQQRLNPGSGPQADRPGSAFGIKTGGPRPMPSSQSMGNLHPAQGGAGRGAGFRQTSAGAGPMGYGGGPQQRPSSAQPVPGGNERFHMSGGLPSSPAPSGHSSQSGHGPRTSSRPQSEVPSAARPERLSSLPPDPRLQQRPATTQPRPMPNQGGPGRIGALGGVQSPPVHKPTPPPAAVTSSPGPSSKPSQGPATFEAMGIPQGKQDSDCVVM